MNLHQGGLLIMQGWQYTSGLKVWKESHEESRLLKFVWFTLQGLQGTNS